MALRWDLKPVFKDADPNSESALWTRRAMISATVALVGAIVLTWTAPWWQSLITLAIVVVAFDAGDHRNPYVDDGEDA